MRAETPSRERTALLSVGNGGNEWAKKILLEKERFFFSLCGTCSASAVLMAAVTEEIVSGQDQLTSNAAIAFAAIHFATRSLKRVSLPDFCGFRTSKLLTNKSVYQYHSQDEVCVCAFFERRVYVFCWSPIPFLIPFRLW